MFRAHDSEQDFVPGAVHQELQVQPRTRPLRWLVLCCPVGGGPFRAGGDGTRKPIAGNTLSRSAIFHDHPFKIAGTGTDACIVSLTVQLRLCRQREDSWSRNMKFSAGAGSLRLRPSRHHPRQLERRSQLYRCLSSQRGTAGTVRTEFTTA